jgi:hypothetical protein
MYCAVFRVSITSSNSRTYARVISKCVSTYVRVLYLELAHVFLPADQGLLLKPGRVRHWEIDPLVVLEAATQRRKRKTERVVFLRSPLTNTICTEIKLTHRFMIHLGNVGEHRVFSSRAGGTPFLRLTGRRNDITRGEKHCTHIIFEPSRKAQPNVQKAGRARVQQ